MTIQFTITNAPQTRHDVTSFFLRKEEIDRIHEKVMGYSLSYVHNNGDSEMFLSELKRIQRCQIASNLPSIESALEIINSAYPNKEEREVWTQQRDCNIKNIIQNGDWFRSEGNERISSRSGTVVKKMRVNMRYERKVRWNPDRSEMMDFTDRMDGFYGETITIHHKNW